MASSDKFTSNKADIWFDDYSPWVHSYYWFEVDWTASQTGPGKTTVTWNVYGCKQKLQGRDIIDWISTTVSINLGGVIIYSRNAQRVDYSNESNGIYRVKLATGTQDFSHNTAGAANFTVSISDFTIYGGMYQPYTITGSSKTFNLDTNYPITQCTAPTSITINKTMVKPNDSIVVSWSGAKDGKNNSIIGYRLYYNYGSVPTTSSSSVSASATSYTFTAGTPDLFSHRGQRLYFKVVTIGSVSGKESPISTASTNTLINTLPNAPSRVTEIKDIYESSKANSSINIQINAGSDPQGTATSVYYSTSVEGTYSVYSGSLKMPDQGNSQSYYFKTWDGLEFSSNYTSVILNINSKPTVELTLTPKATLSSKNKPSDASYVVGFDLESKSGANGQNNNTYTYTLEYGNTSSLGSTMTITGNDMNGANITINDIRTYIAPSPQTQYYKVSVVRNDGIEDSDSVSWSSIYCITPIPNMFIYNNSGLENDIGPQTETNGIYYFSNGIYVKYDFDEGYNGAQISCENPAVFIQASANNFSNDYKTVAFNLTNISSYGTAYTFTAQLTYNNENVNNCSLQKTYTRVSDFKPSNFKFSYEVYKPYDLTKETELIFSWSVQDQLYEKYGLAENATYKFIFKNGDNQQEYSTTRNEIDKTTATETQYYTFDNETLFEPISNLNLPQFGEQSVFMNLVVTNLFGEDLKSEDFSIKVNLQYDITEDDTSLLVKYADDIVKVLKQDMSVNIIYNFTTYNNPNSVKIGYKTNYTDWKDIIVEVENINSSSKETSEDDYLEKKKYQASTSLTIPEVSQPNIIYNFRLMVNGVIQIWDTDYNTIWHTTGSVKLLNTISYKEIETEDGINKKLTFSINPSSWGLIPSDNTEISEVYFEYSKPNGESGEFNIEPTNFEDAFTKEPLGKDSTITIDFNPEGLYFTALNARLVFVIKENTAPTTTYTTYTNTVIIYNTAPTVSYRKNHIGINTTPTFSDGIITIQAYQDYKKIYLQNTSTTYIIDVESGNINGFIISGGSWN